MKVETYAKFDGIQREIKKLLLSATESVYICVAWLSIDIYQPIFKSLRDKNVELKLIVNKDNINDIYRLQNLCGVGFSPLAMRIRNKLMHNKFCIIDNSIVVSGSYNWSSNAEGHFENIVVVKNDFELVKGFKHEFEDLFDYHKHELKLEKCHCKSNIFNIAMLGYESGKYNDSTVSIWSVCAKNRHVKFIGSRDEQYLHASLGLTNDNYDFDDDCQTKESMLEKFNLERQQKKRIQSYFERWHGADIHGIGLVECINSNAYYERYDEHPEFRIKIPLINAYFRKIVPSAIDDYEGDVNVIIERHKPVI